MANKEFIEKLTENIPTWKLVLIDKWTDFKVWFWLKTHKAVKDRDDKYKEVTNTEYRKDKQRELTTYQIYLILLGYLTEHDNTEMLKPILTELYRRAEERDKIVYLIK